ncbi:MAG TPA: DUF4124 domain-containing protein [Steroidobacteraceae bacterium]|nr:DUF4124 domain-containing protein [Steroidobacteraceae bacterium]
MLRSSLALAAFALLVSTARADVYKTVDAQGQPHYSDQWSPGAVLIQRGNARSDAAAPPPEAPKSSSAPDPAKEAAKQVQSDMQAIHAEQCKELKAQYDKEMHARRIYQPSEDSSAPKQYMTDTEADAERVKTRQAMDAACADSGG